MTIEETIREKLRRMEDVPDEYSIGVKRLQSELLAEVLSELEQLSRDSDGNIKMTKKNLLAIEDIMDDFKKYFSKSDYYELTKQFIAEFDSQAEITNSFFRKSFKDFDDPSSFALAALNRSKETTYELLASNPTVTVNLYQPIESMLTNAVMAGDSMQDLEKAIKLTVTGKRKEGSNEAIDGKLYKYAKQIAYDTFAIADRGYTEQLSEDIGVEWFVYRGGLVEDSRQFCIERNGKYFHKKEVEAWGNLKTQWQGRMPNTNEKTIFRFAGGWRCNHSILPSSVTVVPVDVIERNIRKGNYNPSEKELEILGL